MRLSILFTVAVILSATSSILLGIRGKKQPKKRKKQFYGVRSGDLGDHNLRCWLSSCKDIIFTTYCLDKDGISCGTGPLQNINNVVRNKENEKHCARCGSSVNSLIITCDHTTKEILLIGDSVKMIKTLVFSIVKGMLKTIPVEDFQRCFQTWRQCFYRCAAALGNYFEGGNVDV